MFRRFVATLYPRIEVVYRSDYPMDEAVTRLRGAVEPSTFHSPFKECVVGRVRQDGVRLQRVIPFFGNSFKPIFLGAFRQSADGVVLEGAFTTFTFAKVFMTIWFGFASIWTLSATVAAILAVAGGNMASTPPGALMIVGAPVFGVLFMTVGYAFLRMCWWLSRGDMDYLSNKIVGALTK